MKEMSTSVCQTLAHQWVLKNVSSWSTITTASAKLAGWAAIAKPGGTFARATPVKTEAFAPTKAVLIIVLARLVLSDPIVNLLAALATVHPAEMGALVSTTQTAPNLPVFVPREQRGKLANKTRETSALTTPAKMDNALTVSGITIALANRNGEERTATSMTAPVPAELIRLMVVLSLSMSIRKKKSASNISANEKPATTDAMRNATLTFVATTAAIAGSELILGSIVTPLHGDQPAGTYSKTAFVTRRATLRNAFSMAATATEYD